MDGSVWAVDSLGVGVAGGTRLPRTLVTSCMVGLSDGCLLVQRRASWNTFFTAARSLQVAVISGSTVSITALFAVLDKI